MRILDMSSSNPRYHRRSARLRTSLMGRDAPRHDSLRIPGLTCRRPVARRDGRDATQAAEWALYAIGLLATIAVTVYVTRVSNRALKAAS
jgi:hypothetical protein